MNSFKAIVVIYFWTVFNEIHLLLAVQVGAREGRGEATASARDEEEGTGKSKLNHYF